MNDLWKIKSKTFWRCTINRLLHWKAYSNVSQLTMSDSSRKQTFWFSRIRFPSTQSWVNSRKLKIFFFLYFPSNFITSSILQRPDYRSFFSVFILIESCPTFILACYMISIKFDIGGSAWGFQSRRCAITRNVSSAWKGWRSVFLLLLTFMSMWFSQMVVWLCKKLKFYKW